MKGKHMTKILMAGVAAVLLAGGAAACSRGGAEPAAGAPAGERTAAAAQAPAQATAAAATPRLVDVGAGKCIPCKAMAPILDGLKAEYAGRMEVHFVDVWQDPDAAKPYGIRMIPTQIFYGADGRELARHEGFMAKDEILARWKAVGVNF
jgi:thioredoxin 1